MEFSVSFKLIAIFAGLLIVVASCAPHKPETFKPAPIKPLPLKPNPQAPAKHTEKTSASHDKELHCHAASHAKSEEDKSISKEHNEAVKSKEIEEVTNQLTDCLQPCDNADTNCVFDCLEKAYEKYIKDMATTPKEPAKKH